MTEELKETVRTWKCTGCGWETRVEGAACPHVDRHPLQARESDNHPAVYEPGTMALISDTQASFLAAVVARLKGSTSEADATDVVKQALAGVIAPPAEPIAESEPETPVVTTTTIDPAAGTAAPGVPVGSEPPAG